MKKNLRKYFVFAAAAMAAVLCFGACGPKGGGEHTEHSFSKNWSYNSSEHWHDATCGHEVTSERAAHTITESNVIDATCEDPGSKTVSCSICGYSETVTIEPHGHELEDVPMVLPTCETDGATAHKACKNCDYEEEYKRILKTGRHFYDTEHWTSGENTHWHAAACGCSRKSGEALHTYDIDGVCTVCQYKNPDLLFIFSSVSGGYRLTSLTRKGKLETELTVPATYNGGSVVEIADYVFEDMTGLTSVQLPATLTSIGKEAFSGCTSLETVNFAEMTALRTIGEGAFYGCSSLQSAELPASVITVSSYAFDGCSGLATASLPEGLINLGDQVFNGCVLLEEISIPNGVTILGSNLFHGCAALSGVTLPNGLRQIGTQAFAGCAALQEIALPAGLYYIGQNAFRGCGLTSLTVPAMAKETFSQSDPKLPMIANNAFADCTELLEATVEAGVEYHFGSWFAGCEKLATLTIPFVGSNINSDNAVSAHLGYLFGTAGQNGEKFTKTEGFYIPNSLKTVNILGGTVTADAFTNCANLTAITAEADVNVQALTFTGCTANFHWKKALPAPAPAFSAETAETETPVTFSYTAEEGSKTEIAVVKGDAPAAREDYTYDEAAKTFTFHTEGTYTVTVTVSFHGETASGSATVTVTLPDPTKFPPEVTFTAAKETLTEGETVTLTLQVTYTQGDAEGTVTYAVFVKEGENFVNADPSLYEWVGSEHKEFKPLFAGEYQIEVTVTSQKEHTVKKSVTFTATPAEITLGFEKEGFTNGWKRAALNADVVIAYTLDGNAAGYEVSYSSSDKNASVVAAQEGTGISVRSTASNTVIFTVTYTHKTVKTTVKSVEIPVSFVTSVENSPVFAEDPFGGTYGKILISAGLQLYFDAKGADGSALTYEDVSYAIVEGSNTTGKTAAIYTVAGNAAYPYLLVEDFGENTASGSVAVRMTVTKNNETAVAEKTFEVFALAEKDKSTGMNEWVDHIFTGGRGAADFDIIMEIGNRENAVFSKDGVFVHRKNNSASLSASNILCATIGGKDNFRLDFDYALIARWTENQKTSVLLNYRTGTFNGWCGDNGMWIYTEGADDHVISTGSGGSKSNESWDVDGHKPSADVGKVAHLRLEHRVEGDTVHFVWTWSEDGEQYFPWYGFDVSVSTEAGNIGAPIDSIQFRHENGCFRLGNFKLTAL